MGFEGVGVVEFIEDFSGDLDGVLVGIGDGQGVGDSPRFLLLLHFKELAEGRMVVMWEWRIWVHELVLGDFAGLDLLATIAHLTIKNIIERPPLQGSYLLEETPSFENLLFKIR